MLEKSSSVVLSTSDLEAYKAGDVSDRLKQDWNISFAELDSLIKSGQAVLPDCKPSSHTCCGKCAH